MRYALGLQYDGSSFAGWQKQIETNRIFTIQNCLESALSRVANSDIEVVCAGRTDAGVHALQQVVHFDTERTRPLQAWVRGTNASLPKSVSVRWALPVETEFHARFSAIARRYTYVLISAPLRPALANNQAAWTHLKLNMQCMQEAANLLLGEHDFSTFRASQCQASTPIRHISEIKIVPKGNTFFIHIQANAFLHHMVRNIVGALVYVGSGRWKFEDFKRAFDARDRRLGAPTFWADGLYFCGPVYPASFALPEAVEVGHSVAWPWSF